MWNSNRSNDYNGVELSSSSLEAEMAREDDARDSRLEVCNDAYYGAGEDIATALIGYLQRHRDEIHLPRRTVLAS